MKGLRHLFFAVCLLALLVACSQPNSLKSTELEPQFGTSGYDAVNAIAATPRGDIFAAGSQNGTPFLRRYGVAGNLPWLTNIGNAKAGGGVTAADPTGNTVAYAFAKCRYVEGSEGDTKVYCDSYLRKYDRLGKLLWQKVYPDPAQYTSIRHLQLDTAGNVYIAGNGFGIDNYLRKYSPTGAVLWTRDAPGFLTYSLIVSPQGTIYLASQDSAFSVKDESFLTRYDSKGNLVWSRSHLYRSDSSGYADLALGPSGELFLAYTPSTDLPNPFDPVLLALDSSGNRRWLKTFKIDTVASSPIVTVAPNGSVTVAMQVKETPEGNILVKDFILARYTTEGYPVWMRRYGVPDTWDAPYAIATPTNSDIYLGGFTEGPVNGQNFGWRDAFLYRLDANGKKVWER